MADKTNAPPWLAWSFKEKGQREIPGPKSNARIIDYRRLAKIKLGGDDGAIPWCAIFVNAALESVGVRGSRSAAARSFSWGGDFIELDGPALGAIAVFWRGSPKSGLGHVGFYVGETPDARILWMIEGNTSDQVKVGAHARRGGSLGLIGYFWPKDFPKPAIARIIAGNAPDGASERVV
jgi:uncharacterized protein (TIGR02594 family)